MASSWDARTRYAEIRGMIGAFKAVSRVDADKGVAHLWTGDIFFGSFDAIELHTFLEKAENNSKLSGTTPDGRTVYLNGPVCS